MTKSATVIATNSRQAVAKAAAKLGLPSGYKVKGKPKFNRRTGTWKVSFTRSRVVR